MFQNFDAPSAPVTGDGRLRLLRQVMARHGATMLVVPHNDEQNNEYLPADKERLAWLTGFTGSAGRALVTNDGAYLFVDGRYTLQAAEQTDSEHWTIESLVELPAHRWIQSNASPQDVVAFDPWLHTANQVKLLEEAAKKTGCSLIELPANPIDEIWQDQPPSPLEPTRIHDFEHAGRLTRDKLQDVHAKLDENGADLCILTDPSAVCWLFNIRGQDVAHTPISLSHAILRNGQEPLLIIDQRKLDMETKAFLTQVASMQSPSELSEIVEDMSPGAKIMLDCSNSPYALNAIVEAAGGTVVDAKDPVSLLRAAKNDVELAGTRNAHKRDGAAVTTFLCWLDDQSPGTIDEITAAKKLEQYRRDMAGDMPLKDISFDTISGSGPNGAIVHYRVNASTNRVLQDGELYLSDSGGQYDDGTTDITRTIAIGEPGSDERRGFTLVLKGHIAIARARFPSGTRGVDIDALARLSLWSNGFDFAHGTGHGVGSYLAVHEGPQNISKHGLQKFLPGMIISNEPGYYRSGAFGIRLENLVIVSEAQPIDGGDTPMMGFETITLAPFDLSLVDPGLLDDDELYWLNDYHGWVRREISPLVEQHVADWLEIATRPISRELPAASV